MTPQNSEIPSSTALSRRYDWCHWCAGSWSLWGTCSKVFSRGTFLRFRRWCQWRLLVGETLWLVICYLKGRFVVVVVCLSWFWFRDLLGGKNSGLCISSRIVVLRFVLLGLCSLGAEEQSYCFFSLSRNNLNNIFVVGIKPKLQTVQSVSGWSAKL
jgi:hypothetical protein